MKNRWGERTVAMGGGIAIAITVLVGMAISPVQENHAIALGLGFVGIAVLGLIDDRRGIPPWIKLSCEGVLASLLFWKGFRFSFTPIQLDWLITSLWIVGMCNSMNLLDNMDGVTAGVSSIAAAMLCYCFWGSAHDSAFAWLALVVAAASLGFLVHNFNPASIFMGDAGSLSLGFILSTLAVRLDTDLRHTHPVASLIVPFLILSVPIFDTALVILARRLAGRRFLVGGKDHTSHRLVALGLSESNSAIAIYALSGLGAIFTLFAVKFDGFRASAILVWLAFLATLGFFFLRIDVYRKEQK